jgi:hypothetical protein
VSYIIVYVKYVVEVVYEYMRVQLDALSGFDGIEYGLEFCS